MNYDREYVNPAAIEARRISNELSDRYLRGRLNLSFPISSEVALELAGPTFDHSLDAARLMRGDRTQLTADKLERMRSVASNIITHTLNSLDESAAATVFYLDDYRVSGELDDAPLAESSTETSVYVAAGE